MSAETIDRRIQIKLASSDLQNLAEAEALSRTATANAENNIAVTILADIVESAGASIRGVLQGVTSIRLRNDADTLARLVSTYDHSVKVFGNNDKAIAFLRREHWCFDGKTALHMLETEEGAEKVQQLLARIEYGIYS